MEMEAPFDGLLDEPNSNLGRPKLRSSVGSDQPRSQSSSAISDVTSPVKLVGKICAIALGSKPPLVTRIARTGLGARMGSDVVFRTRRTNKLNQTIKQFP